MKKNLIALAVAGALVAPAAMAEVTISGGLQADLVRVGGTASGDNGLYAADGWEFNAENSGNYGFLKFSANEDLGGGMKALAVYNFNTNVGDGGTAGLGSREAYVGLSTGLGTVLAGTLSTPYKSSTVGWDPLLATSFQARGNYGMSTLHNGYLGNAAAYANSFFGGMVKVVAALGIDESGPKRNNDSFGANTWYNTDDTTSRHAKSFSVNVTPFSGLDVALAYIDTTNYGNINYNLLFNNVAYKQKNVNATKLGAKYTAGPVTVAAQVEQLNSGMTNSGLKGNVYYVSTSMKLSDANSISVGLGRTDAKVTDNTAERPSDYAAVGFVHAFSKNTSATVGYRLSNDKANTVGTKGDSRKESAAGVSLRVNF